MKRKMMMIKINEINEIKVKAETKTKKDANSKIRISIIIFTMRRPLAERASTQKRIFKIIKSFVNMLLIKCLCDIYACEKTFFNLFKGE